MERFVKILILMIVGGIFYLVGCSTKTEAYSTTVGGSSVSYEVVTVRGEEIVVFKSTGGHISAVKL